MTASEVTTPTRATAEVPSPRPPGRPKARPKKARVLLYLALCIIALIILLPIVWIVLTSFKTDFNAIDAPLNPVPNPFTTQAYQTLASGQQPIFLWFLNSLAAALLQTAIILVTASLGAYALARLEFRGKKLVFGAIVTTLLVPPVIFLIPNYLIVQNLGWLDSIWAITIPGAAGAFGIFFLRQFFVSLPQEIEEAARMDGAGDFRIFWQMVIPLARPALATLAVLSFLSPEHQTLQPGLAVLQGAYSTHFSIVMAGAIIASIPVLILFTIAQRQIVESVASSGVKG
jgi:multiple sugar transport system permease protein